MSKIETHSVTVTKTTIRYSADEYQEIMVARALVDADMQVSSAVSTHVHVDGEDVIVELMLEEGGGEDVDVGPRPQIR